MVAWGLLVPYLTSFGSYLGVAAKLALGETLTRLVKGVWVNHPSPIPDDMEGDGPEAWGWDPSKHETHFMLLMCFVMKALWLGNYVHTFSCSQSRNLLSSDSWLVATLGDRLAGVGPAVLEQAVWVGRWHRVKQSASKSTSGRRAKDTVVAFENT